MQKRRINLQAYSTIIISALIIRLVATIFSQGYGMHDDHFLVVEASSSWVDGHDYNNWLPWSAGSRGAPEGHSFTYVGINYLFFAALKSMGISDPKVLMLINRLVHALFSLLIVHFGFKLTERLSNRKNAVIVGWTLALLWVMPFLSVRNLVEITCIPFILWSIWEALKDKGWKPFIYAGLLMGISISIRYQVGVFALGMAAVLFFQKKYKGFALFSGGVLLMFGLTQGIVDYIIWGYPFAEFIGYATYNANEGTQYIPNNNYAMYFLVLMAVFLFPLGLLIGVGFFKSWKKYALIFVPVMIFILFHTFYPSKQERFILPVMPLFLMLGVMGYESLKERAFWQKLWRFSWPAFWVLNIPLLAFASFTYSKQSRVESMYFFYGKETQDIRVLQEATGETDPSLLPKFYSGNWTLRMVERRDTSQTLLVYDELNYNYDYILFCGEENLQQRITEYVEIYPQMELAKKCTPSFVDRFLRWLNPRNRNEYIEIWKTNFKRSK